MKEIKDIAAKYAAGKTTEVIDKAIAQAYADGYRDGYKDCEEEIPVDLRDNKTEYVDLGLPSGTLWATEVEKDGNSVIYLPYCDAKQYSIPSREQFQELITNCRCIQNASGMLCCVGTNGNKLIFPPTGRVLASYSNQTESYMWLDEETESNEKIMVRIVGTYKETKPLFEGFKLPIRQVKIKKD